MPERALSFRHALGDGFSLGLRDLSTVAEMHALTERNVDRLRASEPWAHHEQTLEGSTAFTRAQLEAYARGEAIPCVLYSGASAVGGVSLRLDRYLGTGELGYWVDRDLEGRGAIRRACEALLSHARAEGLSRVEIRTGSDNERSRALAGRLGFVLEGVLRSALPLGERRIDIALYALLLH